MKKAILLVNLPERCAECPAGRFLIIDGDGTVECIAANKLNTNCERIPGWCPLRSIPEDIKLEEMPDKPYDNGYMDGWNGCIEAVLGDNED